MHVSLPQRHNKKAFYVLYFLSAWLSTAPYTGTLRCLPKSSIEDLDFVAHLSYKKVVAVGNQFILLGTLWAITSGMYLLLGVM